MKKSIVAVLALGLVVASLGAPAGAAKKKKKKAPKPVATTLYFHGAQTVGEAELPDRVPAFAALPMDKNKPAAGQPKSHFVTSWAAGPNTNCDGNTLLPWWKGNLAGTVVGDVKVAIHNVSIPSKLTVDVLADPTNTCDDFQTPEDESPPPAATQTVDVVGPGTTVVTFKNVKFKTLATLGVQLSIPTGNPGQVRALYDSADYASNVSFKCIPSRGKSCTF